VVGAHILKQTPDRRVGVNKQYRFNRVALGAKGARIGDCLSLVQSSEVQNAAKF
jgi:hypothetical protein